MSGARSRLAAAEILMNVLEERRTLDEALSLTRSFESLSGPDRGFARAMASAALRQLGRLQIGLAPFLNRPLDTATPPARALLLIGAAQLWLMETPSHAGVGETVAAAKLWPRAKQSAGFLNAVLRKAAANRDAFEASPPLSIWPEWLQDTAIADLGTARAERLAYAQMSEPNLHLSCKPGQTELIEADFAASNIETERLPSGSLMVPSGAVDTYPRYASGDWWVQDSAAALPAKLLSGGHGRVLVDLCAAPGGKTMQLTATGAKVYAVDRSAKRLRRVAENLQRTGMQEHAILVAENGETWRPDTLGEKIDGVLVDAPCSALGTLRRHPEGPWIKRKDDLDRYPDIQKRLLIAALDLVRIGGEVIYCVCSPFSHEGSSVVQSVLRSGQASRKPIQKAEITGFEPCLSPEGNVLTLPDDTRHHDAFFMARLVRER